MSGRLRFKERGQAAMKHPYWTKILGMPERGANRFLADMACANKGKQQAFLTWVAHGFFPISHSSPQAFGRVAEISQNAETRRLARFIYEVELGLYPLVKGAPHQGIPHTEQFRQLMESLVDGISIPIPLQKKWEMLRKLDLAHADLAQPLASCYVIEDLAGPVINYFQDFVSRWQVLTRRPSRLIRRAFLDEHSLTEGDLPEQHSGIVKRMLDSHKDLVETERYGEEKKRYNEVVREHLDRIYKKICGLIFEVR